MTRCTFEFVTEQYIYIYIYICVAAKTCFDKEPCAPAPVRSKKRPPMKEIRRQEAQARSTQ